MLPATQGNPQGEDHPVADLPQDASIGGDAPMAAPSKPSLQETTPNSNANNSNESIPEPTHRTASISRTVARNACASFALSWFLALSLSAIGIIVGEFTVAADNAGWQSRGTLIADRHTQVGLVLEHQYALSNNNDNNDDIWDNLVENVQPGWESDDDVGRRQYRALTTTADGNQRKKRTDVVTPLTDHGIPRWNREFCPATAADAIIPVEGILQTALHKNHTRRSLQETSGNANADNDNVTNTNNTTNVQIGGCDSDWYFSEILSGAERLWPIWRTKEETVSALESEAVQAICTAEQNTQRVLQERNLCFGCSAGSTGPLCAPPLSVVLLARLSVGDYDLKLPCDELASAWANVRMEVEAQLVDCVVDLRTSDTRPESCPFGFSSVMVDDLYSSNNQVVRYTSSLFATYDNNEALYDNQPDFDRGDGNVVEAAYDTQYEAFVEYVVDASLVSDMILALASAAVTALAILTHTRSPFLTGVGLAQIVLSFPLAYFVYRLVAGLKFFPFLNFIGVFVIFALGADDIFVAVDKWKNARLDYPTATTEQIAAIALPDAAGAMFLTTVTTAVAFFGTTICPVAPLTMFAAFVGLLVVFDYVLCILLVFPALCLYDRWLQRGRRNCCITLLCRKQPHLCDDRRPMDGQDDEAKQSLIRRILTSFYNGLHYSRWVLLVVCIGAMIVSGIFATTLTLPDSSDVRLLNSRSSEFERNYEWRLNLLSDVLEKQGGSRGYVIWGVKPADTGNSNDPEEWSQLVLDESFDPSPEVNQEFLLGFCENFFSEDFASVPSEQYECPMNAFNLWLQNEAAAAESSSGYGEFCGGATEIPVPPQSFDACITAWSKISGDSSVLSRSGEVTIIFLQYQSRVRYDSKFDVLDREWKMIEEWMDGQGAPEAVGGMFSSSEDFWWYDTNASMLTTAYGAAAIALGAATIVMLISSRSLEITFFALLTIAFILLSVTSLLVASGWTLGFLESVCFAILIGVSCDFVIHFGHSYSALPGEQSRHIRSKHALIRMGPSILAAAFTTMAAAIVMIFTVISFFQKFAMILFYTVIMASIGSFVVFLTLTDTLGPSNPTVVVDALLAKIACQKKERDPDYIDSIAEDVRKTENFQNGLTKAPSSPSEAVA